MDFVTITSVMPQRGSPFLVSTDYDETPILMDYEIVYCRGICQGRKYTPAQWDDIVDSEMQRNARIQALKLLTGKDMTSGMLYKKLLDRGIEQHAAAKVVSRCIELGEINDKAYALRAAKYCLEQKRYGMARAYQWMVQKGVPKEDAQEALNQISPQIDTIAQLKTLIQRRYAAKLESGDYRQKQNVIAALARRGYRIGEIQTAISAYLAEQQKEY